MDFPSGPVVKTVLPLQGAQVRSLVGELRSHMLRGAAKKIKLKCVKNKMLQHGKTLKTLC